MGQLAAHANCQCWRNMLCNENYNYLKYLGVRWDYVAVLPD